MSLIAGPISAVNSRMESALGEFFGPGYLALKTIVEATAGIWRQDHPKVSLVCFQDLYALAIFQFFRTYLVFLSGFRNVQICALHPASPNEILQVRAIRVDGGDLLEKSYQAGARGNLSPLFAPPAEGEEVFVCQLHRRARLVNSAFQAAVVDFISSHAAPVRRS